MDGVDKLIAVLTGGARILLDKPIDKMSQLVPEERDLANSLIMIAKRYGKFNEDGTGIWAGYDQPENNEVKEIGVKCSNCVLYEGGASCAINAAAVKPEGKCRFAIIPDGVVEMKTSR